MTPDPLPMITQAPCSVQKTVGEPSRGGYQKKTEYRERPLPPTPPDHELQVLMSSVTFIGHPDQSTVTLIGHQSHSSVTCHRHPSNVTFIGHLH